MDMPDLPRLLFVDDEPNFLHLVEVYFDWGGHAIVKATSDPEEACEVAGVVQPDFIFVDTIMPGVDGENLARGLKDQAPNATLVSLSGLARETTWAEVSLVKSGDVLETIRQLIRAP
jgi:CheY-like chemotaxis protein